MERLRRFREPAAYVVLAALAVQIVLAVAAVGYYTLLAGPSGAGTIAAQQLSRTLVILAAVVVGACALWGQPTPHARAITLAGIVLFSVHGLLALVLAVFAMFESSNVFAMVTMLLELLVPGLAVVVLVAVRSALPIAGPPQQFPPSGTGSQFGPRQLWDPAPNIRSDLPSDRLNFRSQTDQFANPYSNSADQYGGNAQQPPVCRPESEHWQPVQQPGPQRLEPSPYSSPVGPHSRPDGAESGPDREWQGGPGV